MYQLFPVNYLALETLASRLGADPEHALRLNPGIEATFPRLSQTAANFEECEIKPQKKKCRRKKKPQKAAERRTGLPAAAGAEEHSPPCAKVFKAEGAALLCLQSAMVDIAIMREEVLTKKRKFPFPPSGRGQGEHRQGAARGDAAALAHQIGDMRDRGARCGAQVEDLIARLHVDVVDAAEDRCRVLRQRGSEQRQQRRANGGVAEEEPPHREVHDLLDGGADALE